MHVLDTDGDSSRGSFIDGAWIGESKERYIYSGYTAAIEQHSRCVIIREQMCERFEHASCHIT